MRSSSNLPCNFFTTRRTSLEQVAALELLVGSAGQPLDVVVDPTAQSPRDVLGGVGGEALAQADEERAALRVTAAPRVRKAA